LPPPGWNRVKSNNARLVYWDLDGALIEYGGRGYSMASVMTSFFNVYEGQNS
jgi:hypothetical protein